MQIQVMQEQQALDMETAQLPPGTMLSANLFMRQMSLFQRNASLQVEGQGIQIQEMKQEIHQVIDRMDGMEAAQCVQQAAMDEMKHEQLLQKTHLDEITVELNRVKQGIYVPKAPPSGSSPEPPQRPADSPRTSPVDSPTEEAPGNQAKNTEYAEKGIMIWEIPNDANKDAVEQAMGVWKNSWDAELRKQVTKITCWPARNKRMMGKITLKQPANVPKLLAYIEENFPSTGLPVNGMTTFLHARFSISQTPEQRIPRQAALQAIDLLMERPAWKGQELTARGSKVYTDGSMMLGGWDSTAKMWKWRLPQLQAIEKDVRLQDIELIM